MLRPELLVAEAGSGFVTAGQRSTLGVAVAGAAIDESTDGVDGAGPLTGVPEREERGRHERV
ncbi:hypothetical protein [Streptomyces sp. NPDC001980]|uniref:hypothetical protein n=1 Tax=Streptomyces sp. NPDC001980 TaxID=3157126 RepID=UPI00333193B2